MKPLSPKARNKPAKLVPLERRGLLPGKGKRQADYSFKIWGLLELYRWEFDPKWLGYAFALNNALAEMYREDKMGGF